MKKSNLIFYLFLLIFLIFIILFIIFQWWNDNPPLPKQTKNPIKTLNINNIQTNTKLKIVSYNIHFGIGLNVRTAKISKTDYIKRLDRIAHVLKNLDADIVLIQEIDFYSKRSHFINQGKYLAKKSGYNFMVQTPTLRKKIHFFYHFIIGKIDLGLCILSKYPIASAESIIFDYPKDFPFFNKWLYDPHGAQKCAIIINQKKINVINLHLDPWSTSARENQITLIKNLWLKTLHTPTIIGGDFNTVSPNEKFQNNYHVQDAPWFINKREITPDKEITISTLLNLDFQETIPPKIYLKTKNHFTYPSNDPQDKIDHIFVSKKARIIKGDIYKAASTISDHFPISAYLKINDN